MKKRIVFDVLGIVPAAFCLLAVSCSVDDAYDLSKDIDMTVAVGDGLSVPVGSTDTIRFTEMIDPTGSDVLEVADDGSYVIGKRGTFDAVNFEVDEVENLHINTEIAPQTYSMELDKLFENLEHAIDSINNDPYLPRSVKDELIAALYDNKVAVSLDERIDRSDINFDFQKSNLPKELNRIYRVEFDTPVNMHLEIDVMCKADPEMYELLDSLELSTAGDDDAKHFYLEVPEYIEFVENTLVDGNRLYLDGAVHVNKDRSMFVMDWDFRIKALDFGESGYEIKDGKLSLADKLKVNGNVRSNIVMVDIETIENGKRTFEDVVFSPIIRIDDFCINHIIANVNVDIDDINETVELGLGDDLDFLYEEGTVLDFTDPQLYVTVNNNSVVSVASDIVIKGYDRNGAYIEGSEVVAHFDIAADTENRFAVTNNGGSKEGYIAVQADLSNLFRRLPHSIGFEMKSKNDADELVVIDLGTTMDVSGEYEVVIPLEFNEVALTYTETLENVLGDNPSELTDYINNVEQVRIDVEILNTVPADFVPAVLAYDAGGKQLKNIVATVEGKVAAGNGMQDGKLTAPVKSSFRITLSAGNSELGKLDRIDLELRGAGSGILNSNEYIKIEKMTLNIEKPIEIDLN